MIRYLWLFVYMLSFCKRYYFLFKKQGLCHETFWCDRLYCKLFKIKLKHFKFFGTGSLKVVHVAAYSLKSANLTSDSLKILGVHFSYNKKLQNDKTFSQVILDTQNTLIMVDEKSNYKRKNKKNSNH